MATSLYLFTLLAASLVTYSFRSLRQMPTIECQEAQNESIWDVSFRDIGIKYVAWKNKGVQKQVPETMSYVLPFCPSI